MFSFAVQIYCFTSFSQLFVLFFISFISLIAHGLLSLPSLPEVPLKVLLFSECNWLNNCLCISFPTLLHSLLVSGLPPPPQTPSIWLDIHQKPENGPKFLCIEYLQKAEEFHSWIGAKQDYIHNTSVDTANTKATVCCRCTKPQSQNAVAAACVANCLHDNTLTALRCRNECAALDASLNLPQRSPVLFLIIQSYGVH